MPWEIHDLNSIYLPQIQLWCDAHFPTECSFVSHAHSDHTALHHKMICSAGTSRLMGARLPGVREEIILPFEQPYQWNNETELRLYSAGHIFGSAQLWLNRNGETLLYTGDFKLRKGLSAEPCATPHADVVIMETTFGLPHYTFPPTEKVLGDIIHFCRQAIEDHEIPVLFGYSLGKSQEILCGLHAAGLPIMLHPQTVKMTRLYESMGVQFPAYRNFSLQQAPGHVVICPPQTAGTSWLRKIQPRRTAVITGWAMDPACVYRYQCDAAFPISDHADYPDLLRFVELVQPKQVWTVHGSTVPFAQTLRDRGIEAWALGRDNQLEIKSLFFSATDPSVKKENLSLENKSLRSVENPDEFLALAQVGEKIKVTASKLEKIALLSDYFKTIPVAEIGLAAIFLTGRPFAQGDHRVINCGWSIIRSALLLVSGITETDYRMTYRRYSDSGETAEAVLNGRTIPRAWKLKEVSTWFNELQHHRGPLLKREHLQKKFAEVTPLEGKYLVKIMTGDLRIGLKEGLVEEALAKAFDRPLEFVREANMLTGNLAAVAEAAEKNELDKLDIHLFRPIQFMLASPEPTAESIVARLGETVWIEEKYDGIRCQIHKEKERVELYSRDLKRITDQFPDLAKAASKLPDNLIADGELLAWQNGRALPFAELQKRLGRKGDDLFLGAEIPVSLWLYDLLWLNGENLLKQPLKLRREKLQSIQRDTQIELAPQREVTGVEQIEGAFLTARQRGNEGLMVKDPASIYTPGRRGQAWLKLKKAFATLDVVVVGVEWGHGRRRSVLSDYTFAVRRETTGELLTIGKAYSGLTDQEIATMTEYFLQHTTEDFGHYRLVQPNIIIEVAFDSIQASKRHQSGYALRFPRIVRLRDDKKIEEIDTLEHCHQLANRPMMEWEKPEPVSSNKLSS